MADGRVQQGGVITVTPPAAAIVRKHQREDG